MDAPRPGNIRANITERDGPVFLDDCIEFFLDPNRRKGVCLLILTGKDELDIITGIC